MQPKKSNEQLLLPEEYNLVGICRIEGKPHPFKYKAPFYDKRKATVIKFKSMQ